VLAVDVLAFARANLPPPPVRVLEVGAGDGELARALAVAGYDVVPIDPEPSGENVVAVPLHELDEPPGSFDAALAVVSLHHVEPLDESCRRLSEVVRSAGTLLVDEFDVGAFDERAAAWLLGQWRTFGIHDERAGRAPAEIVDDLRAHLHPIERIVEALSDAFEVARPLRGSYLYRWDLPEALRSAEEVLIGRDELPAVGARFVAQRRS
jgi:SAM-dependent methyltransferase